MSKITSQDIASYAAVIVATVALYVGYDQAQIGRNQQHADVYPVLQLQTQYLTQEMDDGTRVRSLSLSTFNAGVGPAFVETATWRISGKPLSNPAEIVNFFPEGLRQLGMYQGATSNFVLGPAETFQILEVAFPDTAEAQPLLQEFMSQFWAMELSVCYCSLYEKCWETQYNAENPRPPEVNSCKSE